MNINQLEGMRSRSIFEHEAEIPQGVFQYMYVVVRWKGMLGYAIFIVKE